MSIKAFANPEDQAGPGRGQGSITFSDPDVERIRRAHQNDIENIPLFLLAAHF